MPELKWKLHVFNFNPTAAQLATVGPTTFSVMGVKRGTWVRYAAVRVGVAFTGGTPTISIGDADVDGFVATADITIGAAGLYAGWGGADSYFRARNGRLYTTNDTVDLVYTGHAATTQGSAVVYIVYAELE